MNELFQTISFPLLVGLIVGGFAFGVLFSTFLSGPVAMASTFGILIAGYCKPLFLEIAHLQSLGGGPVESFN